MATAPNECCDWRHAAGGVAAFARHVPSVAVR